MNKITIYLWSTALLALFAGGSITILLVLIPFWQSLQPNAIMVWFGDFGPLVGITMVPMQIIPLILSVYAYFLARKSKAGDTKLWLWIIGFHIIILIMLFAYYLPVNFSWVNKTMNPDHVLAEMKRWKLLHIARTILSILSWILAIVACKRYVSVESQLEKVNQ